MKYKIEVMLKFLTVVANHGVEHQHSEDGLHSHILLAFFVFTLCPVLCYYYLGPLVENLKF